MVMVDGEISKSDGKQRSYDGYAISMGTDVFVVGGHGGSNKKATG